MTIALGSYLAQLVDGYVDVIVEMYSMSTFFLIFTLIPIGAGLILLVINPLMRKMIHGVR